MLVLTRKAGQAIAIGDEIEITVVEVRGDQVRLGIRAPRDVAILRREMQGARTEDDESDAEAGPPAGTVSGTDASL